MHHAKVGFGAVLVVASWLAMSLGQARAQAVAYQPNVGTIPDGIGMTVVPVVSADRRYVRVSVDATFQTVNGFQNLGVPFAVSGFGGAGNAGAGLGLAGGAGAAAGAGLAGGGGGGPAGLRSVGVAMGMDGPVTGAGMGLYPTQGAAGLASNGFGYGDPGYGYGYGDPVDDGSWTPAPRRSKTTRRKPATSAQSRKATATPTTAKSTTPKHQ